MGDIGKTGQKTKPERTGLAACEIHAKYLLVHIAKKIKSWKDDEKRPITAEVLEIARGKVNWDTEYAAFDDINRLRAIARRLGIEIRQLTLLQSATYDKISFDAAVRLFEKPPAVLTEGPMGDETGTGQKTTLARTLDSEEHERTGKDDLEFVKSTGRPLVLENRNRMVDAILRLKDDNGQFGPYYCEFTTGSNDELIITKIYGRVIALKRLDTEQRDIKIVEQTAKLKRFDNKVWACFYDELGRDTAERLRDINNGNRDPMF